MSLVIALTLTITYEMHEQSILTLIIGGHLMFNVLVDLLSLSLSLQNQH